MWSSKNHECASSRRSTTLPPFPSFVISILILQSTVSLLSRTSVVSSAAESVFVVYHLFLSFSLRFVYFLYLFLFQSAHASLFIYLLYGLFVSFQCERHTYRFHRKYMQTSLLLFFFNLIACTYSILFYFYMTIFYSLFFIVHVHIHSFFILSLLYLLHRVVSKDMLFPHHSVSCCLFYLVIPTPCKPCLLSLALCT